MRVNPVFTMFVFLLGMLLAGPAVFAANEGQADLDKALELNLTAQSEGELSKVVELAEGALAKGLDKDNTEFANQLLGATYFRRAKQLTAAIFEQVPPSQKWQFIRKTSLAYLEKAQKYDPKLPDSYLLIARLQAELPMGDLKAASDAIDEAVKLLKDKDDSKRLAQALVLRARMNEDEDAKFADFDAAVKADPTNADALQARARMYQDKGQNEKAIADLKAAVDLIKDDFASLATLAEQMTNAKQYDEALKLCDRVIKGSPKETLGYTLRARVRVLKDDDKGALEDLNEALKLDSNDVLALLFRSDLYDRTGKKEEAKADLDKAVRLRPDVPGVILSKAQFNARLGNFADAIRDVQLLLRSDPRNKDFRLQMAVLLQADKRPRRAIEVLTSLIEDDPKDADLYRTRGDALLSVNKHAEAIKDYEEALKIDPEDTGVLNNLAWVLATSETESLRDADRSIKLGTKACELTKYEKPHILSTLASGYAEKGDWENAIKWSTKAVELGEGEVKENLQKELDSYKMKKPWREAQNVEENTKPLDAKPSRDLET
jgi:tetratricopeptide (TPR) repeat protein